MDTPTCATCAHAFTPKRGRAARYCSTECYYGRNGRRVTEERQCEVCGNKFWPEDEPKRDKRQRACSRTCADILRDKRVTKRCAWCGDDFAVKSTTADRRVCCSRKCSAHLREQRHRDEWLSGIRGRYTGADGYVIIQLPPAERPKHSSRDDRGRILEHRYVMEQHLGRPLLPTETVHHKNGKRDDNRLENLELWNSSHPGGKRVEDLVEFTHEILVTYHPDMVVAKDPT